MHRSGRTSLADTDDAVVDALMAASRALVSVAARSIAAVDESLSLPQFRALVVLATRGAATVGALADELNVHSSTITRLSDRLVARALVSRVAAETNRREVVVELTPAGKRIVAKVMQRRRDAIAEIVAAVPGAQRQAMVAALLTFSQAAGGATDQAWMHGWGEA